MFTELLKKYLLALFSMVQHPTSFKIPKIIYFFGLFIYFLQAYSNLFHIEVENNWFVQYLSYISEYSTLISLFIQYDSDLLFWIAYIIIHIPLLAIIFYCILQILYHNSFTTQLFHAYFNIWITWFPFIFFDIYIEFNLYLFEFNYIIAKVFGMLVVIIIIGLALSFTYITQCNEFNDINLFKKKISFVSILLFIKAIMILIATYNSSSGSTATIVLILIFFAFSMIDSFIIRPFSSIFVSKSYISNSCIFTTATIIQILLMKNSIDINAVLFLIIGMCPLSAIVGLSIYDTIFMNLIKNENIQHFWIYSQEIVEMYSKQDKRFIIFVSIRNHVNNCNNISCFCQKYGKNLKLDSNSQSIISGNKDNTINYRCLRELNIKFDDLIKLLDSIFQQTLNHRELNRRDKLQYLYVSFLEKYAGNKLLSYYYLKLMIQKNDKYSLFYKLIYESISKNLESKLIYFNKLQMQEINKEISEGLQIEQIVQMNKSCIIYKECFIQIINQKTTIWKIIEQGSDSMTQFIRKIRIPLNNIIIQYQKLVKEINLLKQDNENTGYLKLIQLIHLILYNQIGKVLQFNQKIFELKNRDQYKDDDELNNFNFMKGQNLLIQTGLAKQFGIILNKNVESFSQFFDYSIDEATKIEYINQLMPNHIALIHNQIIIQYLCTGSSTLLYQNRRVYLENKDKYLFPVSLSIRNDFSNMNDCIFNVNLLKISYSDVIMFDSKGRILSMSQRLFETISENSKLFSYEEFLKHALIQILMPKFIKVVDEILKAQQNTSMNNNLPQFENLKCSIKSHSNLISLCQQYLNQSRQLETQQSEEYEKQISGDNKLEIFCRGDREYLKEFANEVKEFKSQLASFQIRFNIYQYFREFKHISQDFLDQINRNYANPTQLSYFIIDIKEMNNVKAQQTQTISSFSYFQQNPNFSIEYSSKQKSISNFNIEDSPNCSEKKGKLNFNSAENQLTQQRFQVESPRIQLETPKDTDRIMLNSHQTQLAELQQKKTTFYSNIFNLDRMKKISENNDPKFISKNELQEDAVQELEQELMNDSQMNFKQQQAKDQFMITITKTKQKKFKKILDEQQSTTSGVSKTEKDNLERVYMSKTMPKFFYRYVAFEIIFVIIPICSLISQSIIIDQDLANVIEVSGHLLIPYYFNRGFINIAQQQTYLHNDEFQELNQENYDETSYIFNESIQINMNDYLTLLNQEIDQYIQIQETDIESRIYVNETYYIIQNYYMYDYQISNYQLVTLTEYDIVFLDLISRFFAITESTDVINDYQVEQIDLSIQLLIDTYVTIIITVIIILFIPLIPQIYQLIILNQFQEKIILLITRVNYDEYMSEIKKLDILYNQIKDLNGLNIITNDFVNIYLDLANQVKFDRAKAKSNLLQTKIYDVKLSIWLETTILSSIYISMCIFLVGSLLFANQIPNTYFPKIETYVHFSHENQHIQHYNFLNEMVLDGYMDESLSYIEEKYAEAIASYTVYPIPLEETDEDLLFLNQLYSYDLCTNSTHPACNDKFKKNFQNGINGVIQQIKLLFNKEGFSRQVSNEYWALIVFFPSFIEPLLKYILEVKNQYLSTYIVDLETGCQVYLLAGGLCLSLLICCYFFKQTSLLYNQIFIVRHLLMFIPYEKFNDQITISLLKKIKEYE